MKTILAVLLLGVASCSTGRSESTSSSQLPESRETQAIVDRVASKHADVARLSIHAVAPGESGRIVASTVPGRVGDASDPEDMKAVTTGQPIVLREGRNLDYTLPVQDEAGRYTMVVGVTISGATGASEAALLTRAKEVAAEVVAALRSKQSR